MDDAELIRRARAADAGAFERLVGPLLAPAYRLAVTMLRDRDEADDAVQEATLKAWKAIGRLREDSPSLRPWFLTIVANQCRSLRRARWWGVLRLPDLVVEGDPEPAGLSPDPDLAYALKRLDPRSRAAIFLRFYEDLSVAEVARILSISETAAKSRIHRALVRLRLDLELVEVFVS